ncbi:MAG: ABC transporter transmembrane domain-containing protein, partial [Candidatus Limnocylindrales bacterium]
MKVLTICKPHLRGHWTAGLLALLLMILQTGFNLLIPWPLKIIFDNVLGPHQLSGTLWLVLNQLTAGASESKAGLLVAMLVIMLAAALGRALTAYASATILASIGLRTVYHLRLDIFDHLQRLSLA